MQGNMRNKVAALAIRYGRAQESSSLQFQRLMAAQPAAAPQDDMIELTVDGQQVKVPKGSNLLQACEAAGVDIPRFCYHQRLSVAGNCRMCLVEVEKSPKPVASCAMPAGPGMNVKTSTPLVKKAREGVMEFLLINHPLDCPICDQGGECDLQDQSMVFGSDRGRFTEGKRAVSDKNLGPLVKTVMTRCIHCTRCVRFAKEVAGIEDLGVTGRGRDSEIGTYVEKMMASELSGNVIDLCPVGALTSKPAAFTYRNWELKPTETIDVSDAMGANIRVDTRGVEVMRIVPRLNDDVNQEWISDKARFQFDALRYQRINTPYVRGPDGALTQASWPQALSKVAEALSNNNNKTEGGIKGSEMRAIAGKLADAESMTVLRDFMHRLGCGDLRVDGGLFPDMAADIRSNYLFNSTIKGVDIADAILLIGSNPRVEAPVLNARIRAAAQSDTKVAMVGVPHDLTYNYTHLGDTAGALSSAAAEKWIKGAKNPLVIVGPGVLRRQDRDALLAKVKKMFGNYSVIHESASRVAALDLGFLPSSSSSSSSSSSTTNEQQSSSNKNNIKKFVYLLNADDWDDIDVPSSAFVVYQGHHGDKGAARADVVLPGAAYTEKAATYVNFEGRPQSTKAAAPLVGDAREDWKILRALSEVVLSEGEGLGYDSKADVERRMAEIAPHLVHKGKLQSSSMESVGTLPEEGKMDGSVPLDTPIDNFFMTDVISRASKTMAKCVRARQGGSSSSSSEGMTAGM
jgi:NADH dehydrogenase (ubiquinone) Fe-S protein 1